MKIVHYAVVALLMTSSAAYTQDLSRLAPGPAAGHEAAILISVAPTAGLSAVAGLVVLVTSGGTVADGETLNTAALSGGANASSGTR